MRGLIVAGCSIGALFAGLPVRSDIADYPARAQDQGVQVAAEALSHDDVKNLFATDLSKYLVVEVAVWPKAGTELEVSAIDFSLRGEAGRPVIRPGSPRTIAGVNQRRSQSRRNDIVLYPTVGLSTGSWGTGTNVGVGVGTGGGRPGPASTDRDRDTMELELDERGLRDGATRKPVAGYVFSRFPGSRQKLRTSVRT
ncbi:MAG: hypothetical protein WKF37_14055 [Bryobacteraceae bacterium]